MKGDVWYLKDATNNDRIIAKFELIDDYTTGNCWRAVSWTIPDYEPCEWDFVAEAYCKWDACTHWWFKGEDFDPVEDNKTHDNEIDAYYHLCGTNCFFEHIQCMCFVWALGERLINECHGDPDFTRGYYRDYKPTNELVELMLKDCVIEKGN